MAWHGVAFLPRMSTPSDEMKRKRNDEEMAGAQHDINMTSPPSQPAPSPNQPQESLPANGTDIVTPTKRKRGRPPGSKNKPKPAPNGLLDSPIKGTPSRPASTGRSRDDIFSTPIKQLGHTRETGTPLPVRTADRSARRKSAHTLIGRAGAADESDDDADEEDVLARRIWAEDEVVEEDPAGELYDDTKGTPGAPTTPVKRGRGRPKGSKNKRTPTPPRDMPAQEHYFFQNRPGGAKTSNNTLSSLTLLDHEDYFDLIRNHVDPHMEERHFLLALHSRSFSQWRFEMAEGFNVCVYGWGSKRTLLMEYAKWLCAQADEAAHPTVVVVNGYVSTLTIRDIFNTIASALLGANHTHKLGSQPGEMIESLLALLDGRPPLLLLVHSIDGPPLRRPTTQALLSRLAAHPAVTVLASAEHPSFPLLWDGSAREAFDFCFHDCTTFAPYTAEVDVVQAVHDLLGRSTRRVAGRDGVAFVLKSLPEKARSLYRVLVAEQLAGMDEDSNNGPPDDDDDDTRPGEGQALATGVEYRALYQKAAEEFICGNEMAFRTLLKEFYDHQMIVSRRDALGTEVLSVPFRREELEAILEDLI